MTWLTDKLLKVKNYFCPSHSLQIFPYGSVPLKTYLPDGDIDLTIICHPAVEDAMVAAVHTILRQEQQNRNAPYEVKDVYFIDAAEVIFTLV